MAELVHSSNGVLAVDTKVETNQESNQIFSEDEENLIARMYSLLGERWSLIAGRVPGRTAQEIEKYWKSKHPSPQLHQTGHS